MVMGAHALNAGAETAALQTVTWIGAITAVFAALIAVAQTDIKRILAYSTVSQLGFMMVGLGAGGEPRNVKSRCVGDAGPGGPMIRVITSTNRNYFFCS